MQKIENVCETNEENSKTKETTSSRPLFLEKDVISLFFSDRCSPKKRKPRYINRDVFTSEVSVVYVLEKEVD